MNQDEILDKLGASIEAYDIDEAEKYARLAMDEGISPDDAINLGLAKGMDTISRLFDEAKIFLPQILMAAKAMEAALDIIEPYMKKGDDVKLKGVIVMGSVKGDIHEIGKNVCCAMLRGAGFKVIPENLTALKEKYNIKIDPNTIIPEDKELINNLFQAGLEMLVTTGYYCQDLGRVMHVTEEEVWEGIKKTPTKLILGEGKDIARFYPRHGNSPVKPIIQGGPTGSPISEDVFVQIMQSYAQEGIVDDLVNGVMTTIEGHPAKSKTPYEIRATMAELRATKEARVRAGRPGLGV